MLIHVLSGKKLQPFLKRQMQIAVSDRDLRLEEFLRLVLEKANEFVPSESGAILLDDPAERRQRHREKTTLAVVAGFGRGAKTLLGKRLSAGQGVVGRVYVSGRPYYGRGARARSTLCVPIGIRDATVGVLELVNKRGKVPFNEKDFELLQIFADYISASIQNFLDAKRNAEIARVDTLTGLANDRHLHAALKREVRRAGGRTDGELALLFMDLDRFKEVNDEHGHLAGSRVLVEVAEVLRGALPWPGTVIARYGGDEYVALLPGASPSDAYAAAENVRVAVERAIFLATSTPDVPALRLVDMVTASIGVACLRAHVGVADGNRLLRAADEAMYVSKRAGRNRVTMASSAAARARTRELAQ